MTRRLPLVLLVLAAVLLAACGERKEPTAAPAQQGLRLMLDYFPNADHAGIYAAKDNGSFSRAGLDVQIQTPSDPAAPLKLLAAGKVDLAISYEPELLLARDKGLQLVAVDVADDEEHALSGARRGGCGQMDRALRSGRRQLHRSKVLADPEVGVELPPQALVEALGAVDVGYRDGDSLEL